MKLQIDNLDFYLTCADKMDKGLARLRTNTSAVRRIGQSTGRSTKDYEEAEKELHNGIEKGYPLENLLVSKYHVRALAYSLEGKYKDKIIINKAILNKISSIYDNLSTNIIESFFQYYLTEYDNLAYYEDIANWLAIEKNKKANVNPYEILLLSEGARFVAKEAIRINNFNLSIKTFGIDKNLDGRFLNIVKSIYYIEQLESMPLGEDNSLIKEVQRKEVYESQYNKDYLGYEIVKILITRSLGGKISDAWRDVVLALAGDPRGGGNSNYSIKWARIGNHLREAFETWLVSFDLKLFLEAFDNYAVSSQNEKMIRMYRDRKKFLEGLDNLGIINSSRLFVSEGARGYINRNYDKRHLPAFSKVTEGKSIIYLKLDNAHIIEGSHECSIRIYTDLAPELSILNNKRKEFSYRELTLGLDEKMNKKYYKRRLVKNHNGDWREEVVDFLQKLGFQIYLSDVR